MWLINRVYPSERSPGYFRDKAKRKHPKRLRKKYGSGLVVSFTRERNRTMAEFLESVATLQKHNITLTDKARRRLCYLARRCGHKIHCVTHLR